MRLVVYQILIFAVGGIFILKALSHYIRKEQTIREFIAIFIFWAFIFAVTIAPEVFEYAAQLLGFKEYINGLFLGSLLVLFYIVFKLLLKTDRQERQITEIVRKIAIENAKKFPK